MEGCTILGVHTGGKRAWLDQVQHFRERFRDEKATQRPGKVLSYTHLRVWLCGEGRGTHLGMFRSFRVGVRSNGL